MFKWFKPKDSVIKFKCYEEDWEIIPKPYPARKHLPEWYKKVPPAVGKGFYRNTVKRCAPFLDAMMMGWIIPLAADLYVQSNEDCSDVQFQCKHFKPMFDRHEPWQIGGEMNPSSPKLPLKFLNYWVLEVPKGWSVLFMPPLNRPDPRFTCFSGVVDCDVYEDYINFPFIWNKPNFNDILPSGTPLVQVVPFPRDMLEIKSQMQIVNREEFIEMNKLRRRRDVEEGHYRRNLWKKK